MSQQDCDAVIIGAGPGGYVAALRIAALGGRATLVECGRVGGVCLNTGCIPTKTLLHASGLCAEMRTADAMGIHADGLTVDFAKMVAHKDKVVDRLTKGLRSLLKEREIQVVHGRGRLVDANTVHVESEDGDSRFSARHVILATGTTPATLPGIEADGERVLNTDQLLRMQTLPESIAIIGAGPNGVESATMLSELGVAVTLIEARDRILPTVDGVAAKEVAKSLKKRKVTVHCGAMVDTVSVREDGVVTTLADGKRIETQRLLVAVGRRTRIDDVGLERAGVETAGRFVTIDEQCRTSVESVYAIGDITGRGPYAHVAYRQGTVAANNIMGKPTIEDYRVVPTVVFSHPELAQVGMTIEQAEAAGADVLVGTFRYQACGAAQAYGEPSGLCSLVADTASRRVLGATIVGLRAPEVIHEVGAMMRAEGTVEQIAETIHAHPSLSEPVAEAADALLGMPLHSL